MKVKILVSCSGLNFSYAEGDSVDVTAELGKDLIKAGYAEEVKSSARKAKGDTNADA